MQSDYPYNNMFCHKNNLTNGHIFATLCHVQNLYIVIELYSQSKKRNGVAQKKRAIWTTKERTLRKITKNYKNGERWSYRK